jgi:formylglycine-generating enzyme
MSLRVSVRTLLSLAVPSLVLAVACGGPQPDAPPAPPPPPSPAPPVPVAEPEPVSSAAPVVGSAELPAAPTPPPPPCKPGMALVPAGTLKAYGLKKQETKVEAFCMDVSETTAEEYATCVKAGKCTDTQAKCAAQATYGVAELANHPMVCVEFAQANAYCEAQGKRLPADQEWELAARGEEGRKYPWGNDAPAEQLCWSGKTPQKGTCATGSNKAGDSPQGIHDLAGGVYEFVTTSNDANAKVRIGRGGSWKDGTAQLVTSDRPAAFGPSYRCGFLGIRCVDKPHAL